MFKDYFYFSRSERIGFYTLVALIVAAGLLNYFAPLTHVAGLKKLHKETTTQIEHFEARLDSLKMSRFENGYVSKYDTIALFVFNPNLATDEEWRKLGLSPRQIRTIRNYQKKGGKFRRKEDLAKIYGISEYQATLLMPFVALPGEISKTDAGIHTETAPDSLFSFDPNTATPDDWNALGLNSKLISTIQNYLSKGGRFKEKSDLKKIYGMSEKTYSRLEPYIVITTANTIHQTAPSQLIELNSATHTQLASLKGIGDKLAGRILKYRDLLGGFCRTDQLLEVYGMKPETFKTIENQIRVDASQVNRININSATYVTLEKHPYISEKEASDIIKRREKKGRYSHPDNIKQEGLLSEKSYTQIKIYLEAGPE